MNCRFAPIDAHPCTANRSLVASSRLARMALQHRPGEGPGSPS